MGIQTDADLILRLYDMRREEVCRKARFFLYTWDPQSESEVRSVCTDVHEEKNSWYRQGLTYWELAYSLANAGAIENAQLFMNNSAEGILFACKFERIKKQYPEIPMRPMPEVVKFIQTHDCAQEKVEVFRQRFAWRDLANFWE